MSDRDEAASVSASQRSSHATSAKDDTTTASTPDQLDSLYVELPSDATELKALVGTMRLEVTKKDHTINKLKEDLDEVKASHSVILQRSAEWQDELETLRLRVPQLEEELRAEKQAKEDESARVKDLRLRAEESRRAIMRLQGEQTDARAKAKADNRRSWVPTATPPPVRDEQEEAELKKSKRASLAFGPNALNLALANRPGSSQGLGHRRTASGSRSVSGASRGEGEDSEEPLSPSFAPGLRGLRLSGTAGANGTFSSLMVPVTPGADDNGSSAPNSRRSSFLSEGARSPRVASGDLPPTDTSEVLSSSAARLSVPAAGAGSQRSMMLSSPALSQGAASSVGVGSPILEDNEEEEATAGLGTAPSKALPNLPSRESSVNFQAHDRELRAKEVEIERLTREMSELRMSMAEAIEARTASEACLKALRDFIAHHDEEADASGQMGDDADRVVQRASFGAGLLKGVKLPPLPTDNIDDDEEAAHVSPQRTASGSAGGWGLKMPTLMRKATSSNGPTPTDEAEAADGTPSGFATWSPRASGSGHTTAKSISSSFAGFGNLLSRTTPTETPPTSTPAGGPSTTSTQSETTSPPAGDETGSGFRSFGWFKRSSVVTSSTHAQPESAVLEEKVSFPPFRSLDHDQLSISRQPSETLSTLPSLSGGPSNSTSASSIRVVGGDALATAARMGDEQESKKVAERVESEGMEVSHRAQRAAEKTGNVEHLTDVVPAFD
ncbi:hypothetical protein PSEUBRA_004292 [Kalmanozyma brasiliensis GHG001]|uniref:Uncharacterized protein n=1 Tax=Kalmanozyma brasiliensis (strain GHG001) TaxID=1365824 RepID=V5E7U9_KALBG|nr:uncharacterized protein PSEUBRA_004292 [Kalmanozyma brasiliensis GHG001]EST06396.1 hypothetical protein PSEUBRA_004292 [Kalmanozyma brasiliensis GHG001]